MSTLCRVTFREEGVDWNLIHRKGKRIYSSHLPRGRCGLKYTSDDWHKFLDTRHLPRGRCGLKFTEEEKRYILGEVTFREEGVDWNKYTHPTIFVLLCHLPRGRCGLKSSYRWAFFMRHSSPSARKVWIEILWRIRDWEGWICHLPRGRCGLK